MAKTALTLLQPWLKKRRRSYSTRLSSQDRLPSRIQNSPWKGSSRRFSVTQPLQLVRLFLPLNSHSLSLP